MLSSPSTVNEALAIRKYFALQTIRYSTIRANGSGPHPPVFVRCPELHIRVSATLFNCSPTVQLGDMPILEEAGSQGDAT